ncbi:MAG: tRNA pseudouridine(38-40) synthase TruA [Planctomycetota bacterium]|nr:tRNA pseudouridine(38-40) synthase TruA [Planctomycetota bacterium]
MPRYALLIAYHGGGFAGWWRQPGQRTVAGELDAALRRLGEQGRPVGASRTDAGVHAHGQLAHLDLARDWEPARLRQALNRQLPPDIAVRAAARVADDWHAVHGVRRKTYRYVVDGGAERDPFHADRAWWVPGLQPALLQAAAALVPGRRDWRAFVRRGERRAASVCTVYRCCWRQRGRWWIASLCADAFLYRLARALVGGMVQVGRGAIALDEWRAALAGARVGAARQQAPAQGLHLWRIVHRDPPAWS